MAGFFADFGGVANDGHAVGDERIPKAVVPRLDAGFADHFHQGASQGMDAGVRRDDVAGRVGIEPGAQVRQDGEEAALFGLGDVGAGGDPAGVVDVVGGDAQGFFGAQAGEEAEGNPRQPAEVLGAGVLENRGGFLGCIRVDLAGAGAFEGDAADLVEVRRKPALADGVADEHPEVIEVIVLGAQAAGKVVEPVLDLAGLEFVKVAAEDGGEGMEAGLNLGQVFGVERAASREVAFEFEEGGDGFGDGDGGAGTAGGVGAGDFDEGFAAGEFLGGEIFLDLIVGEEVGGGAALGDVTGAGLGEGTGFVEVGEFLAQRAAVVLPGDGEGVVTAGGCVIDGNGDGTGTGGLDATGHGLT